MNRDEVLTLNAQQRITLVIRGERQIINQGFHWSGGIIAQSNLPLEFIIDHIKYPVIDVCRHTKTRI